MTAKPTQLETALACLHSISRYHSIAFAMSTRNDMRLRFNLKEARYQPAWLCEKTYARFKTLQRSEKTKRQKPFSLSATSADRDPGMRRITTRRSSIVRCDKTLPDQRQFR